MHHGSACGYLACHCSTSALAMSSYRVRYDVPPEVRFPQPELINFTNLNNGLAIAKISRL